MPFALRKQSVNSKRDQAIKPQSLHSAMTYSDKTPPPKGCVSFPNSATCWVLRDQTQEPMGNIYTQTTTKCMFLLLRWEVEDEVHGVCRQAPLGIGQGSDRSGGRGRFQSVSQIVVEAQIASQKELRVYVLFTPPVKSL